MKTEDPSQDDVVEEAMTEGRTWFPLSQRGRVVRMTVIAVVIAFGAWCWMVFSWASGLENRLIDRLDLNHRELSAQIERLERSMKVGFKQSHQPMDRIEGRMIRIESDIDQIESNIDRIETHVDAIEKYLHRIGTVDGSEEVPVPPAVAAPD